MDQARELVTVLLGMFPDSLMPVLLRAAIWVRENKAGEAEELLGQFAKKFPDNSRVFLPATVSTTVALKERAGDIDGAEAVFDSAIKWWSNAITEDNKLSVIMQEAASFKLKHGREREAFQLFEQLVKSNKSIDVLVGLVTTAAASMLRRLNEDQNATILALSLEDKALKEGALMQEFFISSSIVIYQLCILFCLIKMGS